MKDSILLVATALGLSLVAWLFWRMLGVDGFTVFSTVTMLILVTDNIKLRRRLRDDQDRRTNAKG